MKKTLLLLLLTLHLTLLSCSQTPVQTGAILSVLSQGVTVNGNTPTVGMSLNVGDEITTAAGAEAAIEFYNGSIVRLRENTTITIKKLTTDKDVTLTQERGQTWNRVTKLAGIKSYAVETPNTVATVRGTGFKVTVDDERTWVGVADGTVAVQKVEDATVIAEVVLEEDKQAEIFFDDAKTAAEITEDIVVQTLEADEWTLENIELDEQYVEETYEEAGKEVPAEYVQEFAERAAENAENTLAETEKLLGESEENAKKAEETVDKAQIIIEDDMTLADEDITRVTDADSDITINDTKKDTRDDTQTKPEDPAREKDTPAPQDTTTTDTPPDTTNDAAGTLTNG